MRGCSGQGIVGSGAELTAYRINNFFLFTFNYLCIFLIVSIFKFNITVIDIISTILI